MGMNNWTIQMRSGSKWISYILTSLVNGPQMEIFVDLQRAECEIHSQILKNSAR